MNIKGIYQELINNGFYKNISIKICKEEKNDDSIEIPEKCNDRLSGIEKINVVEEVSNITVFNIDPFNSWKSAFRECVKLSVKHKKDNDAESKERLDVWCTVGEHKLFGKETIAGANAGKAYGEENADNKSALLLINDFDWLKTQFETSVDASGNISEITLAQATATS